MTAPAGWHADPGNPTLERFWDGAAWTEQTRAPAPACQMPFCKQPAPGGGYCSKHAGQLAAVDERKLAKLHGSLRPQLLCPHCQTRGQVRAQSLKVKKGVSGGKATGALLTGGVSLLATGLSRKEAATELHCGNCSMTWRV